MFTINGYCEELKRYVLANRELLASYDDCNLLVSGAAGLIGAYLCDLLITAHRELGIRVRVLACDRNAELLNARFAADTDDVVVSYPIDICHDALPNERVDYVIHAASNTSPVDYATKPIDTIWTNVLGAKRLMDLSVRVGARRFLFCSSVEAYGKNNGDVDEFSESYSGYVDCNTVRAGYPSAKRCVEALCNAYAAEKPGFEFITARIGRYFGPTVIPGDTKAPSQFIGNAVRGEDIILKSAGTQLFSWGYVGDCVTALLTLLVKGAAGSAYNVSDPTPCRLRDFAGYAASAAGTQLGFVEQSEAEKAAYSKVDKAIMNVDKLLELGWKPLISVADGVVRTVNYIKEMKNV